MFCEGLLRILSLNWFNNGAVMRKKALSTLPIIDGGTQRKEPSWETAVALSRLRPYVWLEEYIEQAFQTIYLVQMMDCRRLYSATAVSSKRLQRLNH